MAKIAGKWTSIYFAGYDLTGRSSQVEVDPDHEELDITGFQEDDNSMPGVAIGTVNLTSFLDPATAQSHAALSTPGGYTNDVVMVLVGNNAPAVIGDSAYAMLCKQFKYNVPLAVRSAVLANANFRSVGERLDVNGKVLANTTITNTTNFTGVDNGALTANGGAGYLEVLTPTSTDSYAVKVQHSTDDNTYADLATFSANGQSRTSERQEVAAGTTVNRYTRAQATRTGAAGDNFKLAVVFARH